MNLKTAAGIALGLTLLGGCPTTPVDTDTTDTSDTSDTSDTDEAGDDGETLYIANCSACHGTDGTGSSGPSLLDELVGASAADLEDVITNGEGSMNAITAVTGDDLDTLVTWVLAEFGS